MVDESVIDYIKTRASVLLKEMDKLGIGDNLSYDRAKENIDQISDGEVGYHVIRATASTQIQDDIDSMETVAVILKEMNEIHKRRVKVKILAASDGSGDGPSF